MKNVSVVRLISEIAIFAAIGFVLDEIQGAIAFSFPNGGSIGFAMVAVLIIAYRRGLLPAILTGLLIGLLDISTKAYIVHPVQLFLDYIFPYTLVGFAGLFKPLFDKTDNRNYKIMYLILGTVIGGLLKFMSHYFAGIFFWNNPEDFSWDLNYMSPYLYSFIYNIAFIGPSIILCAGLLVVLFLRAPKLIMTEGDSVHYVESVEQKQTKIKYTICALIASIGLFLFVFFLIRFIQSLTYGSSYGASYYELDRDCMILFAFGLVLILTGINHMIRIKKEKFKYSILFLALGIILLVFSGYGLAKILEMYIDKKVAVNNLYWAWFVPSFVSSIGLFILYIISLYKAQLKN